MVKGIQNCLTMVIFKFVRFKLVLVSFAYFIFVTVLILHNIYYILWAQ